jgi:hypothetical protein
VSKKILKISEEDKFDFLMIGIVCMHRDYRICMELNKSLNIKLSRQDDYMVFNNKRMEDQYFSFYEYISEEEDRYNVIVNKGNRGYLLPEQYQLDYLLLIRMNPWRIEEQEFIDILKGIPIILGAYKLEAVKLKSRENLVF